MAYITNNIIVNVTSIAYVSSMMITHHKAYINDNIYRKEALVNSSSFLGNNFAAVFITGIIFDGMIMIDVC